jgi:hypothetical protein
VSSGGGPVNAKPGDLAKKFGGKISSFTGQRKPMVRDTLKSLTKIGGSDSARNAFEKVKKKFMSKR